LGSIDIGFRDAKDPRRGRGVDVDPSLERVDESRVVGKVREHA